MTRPPFDLVREAVRPLRAYTVPKDPPPVKLDANESPWPLPAEARARVAEVLAGTPFHRYPDPRATALRAALSARVGGKPEELVLGSGSDEVIALLFTALARPREGRVRAVVVHPTPTFVMYRIGALAHGLEPVGVPLGEGFALDQEAMLAALAEHRPNLVFLASPNNPTGNSFARDAIETLIGAAPDTLFVIDEAYAAFRGDSLADLVERHPHVAALGTLSKVGLAAARLGWVRMHPELAAEVDKARQPFNLNALTQAIGQLALTELWPILEDQVAHIVAERKRLGDALRGTRGLHVYPSDANFFLVRFDGDAPALASRLLDLGVGVRVFANDPRLAGHIRITVGTPEENDRFLEALRACL